MTKYPFSLPELGYNDNALEPYIDGQTMNIHRTKHHQAYVSKANEILAKYPDLQSQPLEDLLRNLNNLKIDEADKAALKNNGGGHLNHCLYWEIMGPKKEVDADLIEKVEETFGSVAEFKKALTAQALGRFGSGWAWLTETKDKTLKVYSTANQDSPYLQGDKPLIGLDVWEHAYYLKYQNRRPEYVEAFWNVLKLF